MGSEVHTGWKKAVISQGAVIMPNTYKDATYKEVLCWTADTQIKYSPNPKRGKSKIRYAKYAEAETVAQALVLGIVSLLL